MPDPAAKPTPHSRLTGLQATDLLAQALSAAPLEGGELPGFHLIRPLGHGGMGSVHLAHQVRLDREVAVKILSGQLAGDPLFIERIEREAHTMARLRHPNIVTVHDFLRLEDGTAAIVMEFVEGGSLREKMRLHPLGLPVVEALRIIRQVGAGLDTAHASGVIHRDMKPENVLLAQDGTARVTDFGLALPLQEPVARLTMPGTLMGTVDYMAPEQMRGGALDARLDIYALGVMAYELLTGQTPRGSFDPPHQLRPEVPPHVSEAVMRALRPNPEDRFANVEAFLLAMHPSEARNPVPLAPIMKTLGGMAATILIMLMTGWLAVAFFGPKGSENNKPDEDAAATPPAASESSVAAGATPPPPALTSTVPAPPAAKGADSPGPWLDAIAGAHIHNDNFGGEWQRDGGVLTSNDAICILSLEKNLPESYDVRMKFTRLGGKHSVTLFFRSNGSVGSAELDAWEEGLAGVQIMGDSSLKDGYGFRFPLENGRSYELLVEVRPGVVRMSVDGVFQKEFDTAGKFLRPPSPWNWNPVDRPTALALGSYLSPTRFEKVEWREIKAPANAAR